MGVVSTFGWRYRGFLPMGKLGATVKDHLAVVLLSVIGTSLGLGGTATKLYYDNELSSQKQRYETRLAAKDQALDAKTQALSAIHRQVGKSSDYLDVDKIVISQSEAQALPAGERYFPQDRFYARAPKSWRYARTTELQLLRDLLGPDIRKEVDREQLRGLTRFPLHLWRKNEPHRIQSAAGTMTVYPQAFVQHVSRAGLLALMVAAAKSQHATPSQLAELKDRFARDAPGLLLVAQLQGEETVAGPLGSVITTVQKRADAVYALVNSTFSNVRVDGKLFPQYFWARELVIVGTPSDLYVVKTSIPRGEPRSPVFAELTQWYSHLHFVAAGPS